MMEGTKINPHANNDLFFFLSFSKKENLSQYTHFNTLDHLVYLKTLEILVKLIGFFNDDSNCKSKMINTSQSFILMTKST